jgi:8-oxo-dGTP pyrophosphatase MutT (NUDIX family)
MKQIVPISPMDGFEPKWKPTESAVLEHKAFGSVRHRIVMENGRPVYDALQLIEPGGAAILPITTDQAAVLVRIYRHTVLKDSPSGIYPDYSMDDFGVEMWEAVRGYREGNETWEQVAHKEVWEETGLITASAQHVGTVVLNSAVLPVPIDLCLAEVARRDTIPQTSEGILEVCFFNRSQLDTLILAGHIRCAMTLALVTHAIIRGRL